MTTKDQPIPTVENTFTLPCSTSLSASTVNQLIAIIAIINSVTLGRTVCSGSHPLSSLSLLDLDVLHWKAVLHSGRLKGTFNQG